MNILFINPDEAKWAKDLLRNHRTKIVGRNNNILSLTVPAFWRLYEHLNGDFYHGFSIK